MKTKIKPGRILFLVIDVIFLLIICYICVIPIWHMLMASVSNPTALNTHKGLVYWPLENPDMNAYKVILRYRRLWRAYRNTIFYIVSTCMLTGVLTTIAGYVFSRKRFFYRNRFMMLIAFTMLFHGGMIPTYMTIRALGMVDTPFALVIPGALTVFNIIIMRTAMEGVPTELEEAAHMDGASDLLVLVRVILPLCKATFAVIMLFTAVAKWNDYFSALLYIPTKSEYYPLQMILREILITSTADMEEAVSTLQNNANLYKKSIEYASIVVSTIPILCVYPFVQKYFVTGMTVGAVKS